MDVVFGDLQLDTAPGSCILEFARSRVELLFLVWATEGGLAMCRSPGLHRDEKSLVELARQGDAVAFGEIYERHVSLVYRYAYTLLGNKSEAEDLAAETFLRALEGIRRYRWTGVPLSCWLLTIARNLGLNQLRRRQRTKDALCVQRASTSSDSAEVTSKHGVEIHDLRQAVATLSPAEREVIILRFVLALDYPQVAQVVGKSVNNVRVIQYRALRKLHKKLASAEDPDLLAAPANAMSERGST
jgi:RNA polymerase sigma-70 factor (ECF subfamily)